MMPWVRTERVAAFVFVLAIMLVGEVAAGQTPAAAGGGYRIAGAAVDAGSGQPLARTEVSIELQEGKKVRETYATGSDGRFSFEGLAAGRYTLLAKRRGYVSQAIKGTRRYSTAIVVGPGLEERGGAICDDVGRFDRWAGAG